MKHFKTRVLLPGLTIVFCVAASLIDQSAATSQNTPPKPPAREEAYRANNIGVALLEQYKHKEAADAFKRALQLDPGLTLARINLGIALFNAPDLPAAQRELQAAATAAPNAPQPHYVLGLLAKAQNKPVEAVAAFQKVLAIDPQDVGANVNLGQLFAQQRKYPEAVAVLRTALAAEPYNTTALYNLGTALIRSGQREEGQKIIQQFQALRERGSGTTLGTNYLEQGRYAEAISSTGAEPELVDKNTPPVTFVDVTKTALPGFENRSANIGLNHGAVLLFDFDLDGDLDLLDVAGLTQRLVRNDGSGKFTDVTSAAGALAKAGERAGTSAIAGDYDNDGRPDLFILRPVTPTLYHNDGNGSFSDVTAAAKLPSNLSGEGATAFVDYDHDGDLDIFIAGPSYVLLRNNGDSTFTDQTTEAKLAGKVAAPGETNFAIVPTDFDNRRDVDLLVTSTEKVSLWRNMRDGTFRDVAAEVGLGGLKRVLNVAAGDINKDGFTDFYFNNAGFALSNGKGRFDIVPPPTGNLGPTGASQLLDYDNDGLLDLITSLGGKLSVLRNTGNEFVHVKTAMPDGPSQVLASGDLDNDGDTDLVFDSPGRPGVARNDGGTNRSLRVGLEGRVSNRTGIGAKIEIRSGSLAQKLEKYSAYPAPAPADIVFGLGKRTGVDAVRVLWPAGIVQAETEIPSGANSKTALALSLTELDRKPSSCPYLYVWNGERFEFVTDFLGGGEMGHLDAPGVYNTPDPDEYVRIDGDRLKPRNGRYELRITNELEEALFVDHLQLLAVAHPRDVEVYPNEGLTIPPPRFKLYSTRNAQVPLSAVDEHGHDVLARIAQVDRQYPDDFKLHQIRGYADEHTLTLQLGKQTARTLLLMTGWTDYAWSSDNLAASQSGKSLQLPALQVKDKRGQWKTVIENVGIPVGRPQTIVVDLTGKFLSDNREVRIVTNMRIYWDQILVDTSAGNFPTQVTRISPTIADLRWRGFSLEHSPDTRQPMTYDYQKVSFTSPWKVMTGRYTREGDVRELLQTSDDMFVISRPGDELTLSFPADKLPPLPEGWTRTFLLYADGFSKEMDVNSASPDQVGPLPFHGMSKYPYSWPERYPLTPARRKYLETYNTRVVSSPVPSIALELVTHDLFSSKK